MNVCRYCNIELKIIPEPEQSKLIKMMQENSKIKFIVPIKECPKCKWNRHFGKPMTLEVLHNKFEELRDEFQKRALLS